ncbi:MAG: PCMD domain-containing protein, partial [Prevotella sp.]|nr:PCMD domain-containing protein [Prevotella sp.]
RFGIPFDRKPQRLKGWYKYSPGPKYQDQNGNIIAGRTDSAAIYAVFYRNHDDAGNPVVLYGDNVKTSPQIIAIADLTPVKEAKEWTEFDISFVYMGDIDTTLLENRGYNLTIVCSSSYEGDKFEGAIGSQLLVDKISVICEKEE